MDSREEDMSAFVAVVGISIGAVIVAIMASAVIMFTFKRSI